MFICSILHVAARVVHITCNNSSGSCCWGAWLVPLLRLPSSAVPFMQATPMHLRSSRGEPVRRPLPPRPAAHHACAKGACALGCSVSQTGCYHSVWNHCQPQLRVLWGVGRPSRSRHLRGTWRHMQRCPIPHRLSIPIHNTHHRWCVALVSHLCTRVCVAARSSTTCKCVQA